jgi:hypothetical protein
MYNITTSLLFCLIIRLVTATCIITGEPCQINSKVTGICVPLDSNGESQDCYNVYGFFVGDDICKTLYGENYVNVLTIA